MLKHTFLMTASALVLTLTASAGTGSTTEFGEAQRTLQTLKDSANNVQAASEKLHTFAGNSIVSNATRASVLDTIQIGINQMGRDMASLQAERKNLNAWEQKALDQALPLLKDAASSTDHVIGYFNDRHDSVWAGEYRDSAARISRDTEKIATTIGEALRLSKLQLEEQQTKTDLGVSGN
jgi:hypothetical protein